MHNVKPVSNRPLTGIFKALAYLYLILHAFFTFSRQLITKKLTIGNYLIFHWRLIQLLKVLWHNKPILINGKIRYELYIPSFPSKAFYYAINKFNPQNKNPGPLTVVFSMTKACSYKCPYCYQKNDNGAEVDINLLKDVARQMQDLGVALFDIEGGEPLIRFERLIELLEVFDDRSEIWVNTTGHTLTPEKAHKMKKAGVYGVFVSIHYADQKKHDQFTGFSGAYEIAIKAIKIFKDAGIAVAINFCPNADSVKNDGVEKL